MPGAGLVTLFGRAFLASTLGIMLLNRTVCDGVCLFFNFESFVFDFGGILHQVVVDWPNNATASFPGAERLMSFSSPLSLKRVQNTSLNLGTWEITVIPQQ